MTSIADSVLQAIGGTPVARLRRVVEAGQADVLVKLESINPTGSRVRWAAARSVALGVSHDCQRRLNFP